MTQAVAAAAKDASNNPGTLRDLRLKFGRVESAFID